MVIYFILKKILIWSVKSKLDNSSKKSLTDDDDDDDDDDNQTQFWLDLT